MATAMNLMNGASKSNQDLNSTYTTTTAIDDMKCATAIMPELRKPLKKGLFFLAEYSSATGQPCPGSKPCRSPINATPMYAGLIRFTSSSYNLIISSSKEGIQIKERLSPRGNNTNFCLIQLSDFTELVSPGGLFPICYGTEIAPQC
jgi:hypothetical protein